MAAVAETNERLRGTDGFLVESAEGRLATVEEVWLGEAEEPRALALVTKDGRHALLLAGEVVAVDREQHAVVVPPQPELYELGAPHLVEGDGRSPRLVASWSTTGTRLRLAAPERRRLVDLLRPPETLGVDAERPLWKSIVLLYAVLALIVGLVVTLSFGIALVVTGNAY